jgi:hypothetical protein
MKQNWSERYNDARIKFDLLVQKQLDAGPDTDAIIQAGQEAMEQAFVAGKECTCDRD